MDPDRVDRVTDPASNLEGVLSLLRGSDGGVSAVDIGFRNLSADQDIVLKVNTELSAVIMLTVADHDGTVLSTPGRRFDTSEDQGFIHVRIAPAAVHRWRMPIADQVPSNAIPAEGLNGRLVVNIALLFSRDRGNWRSDAADFASTLLTLYDMDLRFTRKALREGSTHATTDS